MKRTDTSFAPSVLRRYPDLEPLDGTARVTGQDFTKSYPRHHLALAAPTLVPLVPRDPLAPLAMAAFKRALARKIWRPGR